VYADAHVAQGQQPPIEDERVIDRNHPTATVVDAETGNFYAGDVPVLRPEFFRMPVLVALCRSIS
jgi:hypothetical protein